MRSQSKTATSFPGLHWFIFFTHEFIELLIKAARDPLRAVGFFPSFLRSLTVRRIEVDGKIYHKYRGVLYPDSLCHGNAASNIMDKALEYCRGSGLDVGCNQWPLPGAKPIDNLPNENAHRLDAVGDGEMDFVFSSHCLEHLDNWQEALRLWIRKIRPGGVLFLYLPHESNLMWAPGGPWVGNLHRWQPTYEVLIPFLKGNGMEILEFNPGKDHYWSFHLASRKKEATLRGRKKGDR